MIEDLEIKLYREIVFKDSTEQLSDIITRDFVTEEELINSEYQFTTNIDKGDIYLDATEIPISVIREKLIKAEQAGANYISIDFHSDHGEYDIYGLKISRAKVYVIEKENEKQLAKAEKIKNARIIALEKELKKLKS